MVIYLYMENLNTNIISWYWSSYNPLTSNYVCTLTVRSKNPSPNIQLCLYFNSKKIEEIGKMTALSQEEITNNTKTIIQGLDTLKSEHSQILNGLMSSMKTIKKENGDTNLMEEKTNRLKKSLETIELGLSEANVSLLTFRLQNKPPILPKPSSTLLKTFIHALTYWSIENWFGGNNMIGYFGIWSISGKKLSIKTRIL